MFEVIEGLLSQWVVKTKKKIPRIVQWKPITSSKINFTVVNSLFNYNSRLENVLQTIEPNSKKKAQKYWQTVKDYVPYIPSWVCNHQPFINAPHIMAETEENQNIASAASPTLELQGLVEEELPAKDHHEQTHESNDTYDSESRTKFNNDYIIRRMDKIDRSICELKSAFEAERKEHKEFREAVMGFISSYTERSHGPSPTTHLYAVPDDCGVYTDVDNQMISSPMSLYTFYGDASGQSGQILKEVPPYISKFGCPYRISYVFNSPYLIMSFKRGRNINHVPTLQLVDRQIDERTSVDINPLRGLQDPCVCNEFDEWFAGNITMDRSVPYSHLFFQILLGHTSLAWLGDEHIHEYFRLISEKQRQYPNALSQRVTHIDTHFWVFLKQLWNNGNYTIETLQYSDNFNSYIRGREFIMSKQLTDVDMVFIPVNLSGDHWVLVRVDFRNNKVWIYDSLLTFRDDKTYKD